MTEGTLDEPKRDGDRTEPDRRGLLASGLATSGLMAVGLVGGYGACGAMGARYLLPSRDPERRWLFVARADELAPGDAVSYRSPDGRRIAIARQGDAGTVEDFIALSSTCPHLGCQVHWEAQNERFFCPCHNGVFDPGGQAVSGPPAEAGQSLPRFALRIEGGLLYIEVPVEGLAQGTSLERDVAGGPPGPGHDPCLHADGPPSGREA